ncbi:type II toxin-antitoxin system PemK/MazF family toxin [Jannaschia sp. LMIT008]|uniref:type II toxin-antitoxin system PemK/MazF family toxin n=1 Tax=Jannaschia maritima TaxID=3032585 RepID=UPI002810CED2|nr:type II toxin-antitoxin system PemK/MazF family toxin [Jannaschia sp. LMIT008]
MNEDKRPPRVEPKVKAAPRIRQVYWCKLPDDAQLPEFWKTRPVVVMSKKTTLRGKVTVLPMTTKAQPDNPYAHPMDSPLELGKSSWVICDHFMTVAVSRLVPHRQNIPRISQEDLEEIKRLALLSLPY